MPGRFSVFHPTFGRWFDIGLMTFVAVLLVEISLPQIRTVSHYFVDRSSDWSAVLSYLFLLLLSLAGSSVLIRMGAFRVSHFTLRQFAGYPPAWLAAVLSSLVLSGLHSSIATRLLDTPLWLLLWLTSPGLGVAFGLFSFALSRCQRGRKLIEPSEEDAPDETKEGSRFRLLLSWLEHESPIRSPSEDLFGFLPIARRIAGRLAKEKIGTVGVVGPYGTGKTSMLNLVQHCLGSHADENGDDSFAGPLLAWIPMLVIEANNC